MYIIPKHIVLLSGLLFITWILSGIVYEKLHAQDAPNPPTVTISVDGKPLPSNITQLNFLSGPGNQWNYTIVGTSLTLTTSPNTATMLSRANDVQNVDHYCKDTSGSVVGACSTNTPSAWCVGAGYVAGSWVDYVPGATTNGPGWVNVNQCGQASIKLNDGVTDPGDRLKKGGYYHLISDAVVWRMSAGDSALP
jgi:hypothetical protein